MGRESIMKNEKGQMIEVLVRGVCVKEGKLLVCQGKEEGNTYLPGGHVDWGERAEAGLKREIKEELGANARVLDFLGVVEHTFIQKGKRHCEINLVFMMEIPALKPDSAPESAEHWILFRWIPLTRLARHALEPWPLRRLIPGWVRKSPCAGRWGSTM